MNLSLKSSSEMLQSQQPVAHQVNPIYQFIQSYQLSFNGKIIGLERKTHGQHKQLIRHVLKVLQTIVELWCKNNNLNYLIS